jgi:aminoglycoside phosphotransferase family enzyme
MNHPGLIEAMSRPDFYPHKPRSVELVQTHISYVFIADDIVYKVKKAVNFGFLDFTTLEKRKFYCEEELRIKQASGAQHLSRCCRAFTKRRRKFHSWSG